MWRKSVFDIYFTEYGTALTTILPILFLYLNICYSDSRKIVEAETESILLTRAYIHHFTVMAP